MNYTELFTKGAEGCSYSLFYHVWPWMGLGAAIVMLILIFGTNFLRSNLNKSRMKDPSILAWLGFVVYLFHNFEEFGLDLYGHQLGFAYIVNGIIGVQTTEGLSLGCNLPLIWVATPLAAYFVQKGNTKMASAMACFSLLNSTGHIVQGLAFGMYNPGILNAALMSWPLGIWTIYVCSRYENQSKKVFFRHFLAAVAYHIVLISSGAGLITGVLNEFWQTFLTIADAFLIFYIWTTIEKKVRL